MTHKQTLFSILAFDPNDSRLGHRNAKGCLVWSHSKTKKGYGVLLIPADAKLGLIHRASYHLYVDNTLPILSSDRRMVIDHECREPSCFNPDHLRLKTQSENTLLGSMSLLKTDKTSQYPGVYWNKKSQVWMARIRKSGVRIYLGKFDIEEDAHRAYQEAQFK